MTCSLYSKTALYQVGKKGFCGSHKTEACAAQVSIGSKKTGSGPLYPRKEA